MDVSCEMLLHPELLTNEQLIHIIQERHLRIPNVHTMLRDELLEAFHHYCVPYGQRRYRDTGRGKILNKSRHMSPERMPQLHTFIKNERKSQSDNERLKPPPDLLSGHMKRIKLENKNQPVNNVNSIKRKMSVDSEIPVAASPPAKKEKKLITWP